MSNAGPALRRPNTSALYAPLSQPPAIDGVTAIEVATDGAEAMFIHVIGAQVFIDDRPAEDGWTRHVVGVVDDVVWWAVDVPHDAEDPSYGAAIDLFGYYGRASEAEWFAAGRAVQLVEWGRTHRFCGRCGTPTAPDSVHRGLRCPACGLMAFPRLAPAMITLVTRGEPGPDQEALLARGVNFALPMYSCLAGFVEPGEDLEGAVVREVREEVGLDVDRVSYRGSQPWPFPHSLMVGFRAEYVGGDLVLDETEIVDANWYRRDDLPQIPPGISIARTLIDEWLEE
ncbi:MAG: NAD(+) diphosphatase [Ilumatobacteraceae bacterium]|nr:NAD(+) diphosphatase [Ilumatobacteraceae bacterium]